MIQIDDSGSGSLVGGTGIGIYRKETNEYYFDIIPIKYYQGNAFKTKEYQKNVTKLIQKYFSVLNVTKEETIQVCQGYMFDDLRIWLSKNNYNWASTKIVGKLQELVEQSFTDYIINLGLPTNFVKHARFAFGFHRLLKWVFADFDTRKELCKTGWKSWQKWSLVEKSIYRQLLSQQDYCLKCGKSMLPGTLVTTLEYSTIRPCTINLHDSCFQGELNEVPPQSLRKLGYWIPGNKIKVPLTMSDTIDISVEKNNISLIINNDIVLNLEQSIAKKIMFWQKKSFYWHCYPVEIHPTKVKVELSMVN